MRNERIDTDRLIALYGAGVPVKAIASELGISYKSIYPRLHKEGVALRGHSPLGALGEERVLSAYRDGMLVKNIASREGVTRETVHNVLRRTHEPRRKSGPRLLEFSDRELERIAELRRSGMPKGDIAAEMRTSTTRLDRALNLLDLPKGRLPQQRRQVKTRNGYVVVRLDRGDPLFGMAAWSGYVPVHRLVMARSLGRPLDSHETVHHINGDRTDNRLENLQLRSGKHGKGVVHTCRRCGSCDIETSELS